MLHKKWASWLNSITSSQHCLEVSCRRDRSIVLREIPGPLICVRSYAVAWLRALGCLTSFIRESTTEYREWKGKSTAGAVGGKHDPSNAVFSPLSGTDSLIMQRKESGTGEAVVPPHRDAIFPSLATWEKQKKGFISCFSRVHLSAISSAGCMCVRLCVKDNRKEHLVWLHSSHLLIMWLKAIVSDNLRF